MTAGLAAREMASNAGWVYAKVPGPVLKTAEAFELRGLDMPEVKDGMVLAKLVVVAGAPHTLAFLKLPGNDVGAEGTGLTRTELGEVVPASLVAEVIESRSPAYSVGDRVTGMLPLQKYIAFHAEATKTNSPPRKLAPGVPPESAMSMSSLLTAYIVVNNHPCAQVDEPDETVTLGSCWGYFLVKFQRRSPQPQKTVLITSAAGPVGLAAGQMYKDKGCRVIGVTSTRKKADRVQQLGFDHVIAYKEEDMDARLGELAPEGIDVFFDLVGASQMDVGTKHMKVKGKIVQVGAAAEIPNYSTGEITGWKQYIRLCSRELQVGGFLLTNHFSEFPDAIQAIVAAKMSGKLKSTETIVRGGVDKFAEVNDMCISGEGFGKNVLVLDD